MLLSFLTFDSPAWLAALTALPVLGALSWWSATGQGTINRGVSLVLRAVAVVCFVLALAGLSLISQINTREVILLADASGSVVGNRREALQKFLDEVQAAAGDQFPVTVIPFAEHMGSIPSDRFLPPPSGNHTHLERAVAGGRAAIRAGHVARIVLLSDGGETQGDLRRAAANLGMPLDVVPLPALTTPEVGLRALSVPREVGRGGAYSVSAVIVATRAMRGNVVLAQNSREVQRSEIELKAGENFLDLRFPAAEKQGSSMAISVSLAGFDDLVPGNNTLSAAIPLADPTPLLYVSAGNSNSPVAAALEKDGFGVTRRSIGPGAFAGLDALRFDAVFLDGVGPQQLDAAEIATLKKFVGESGGGLVVSGGNETFSLANYENTPLESLLPVRAAREVKKEERQRTLALMLVIDRSQSMLEDNRLGLAKEAARRAVSLLSPIDQVGVIAFGTKFEWISPLGPVGDQQRVLAAIEGLQAEGLTQMYPALVRGATAVALADADRRHLIVLTDGVPTPADFDGVARSLAEAEVQVATVTVSKGADQALMKDIARIAKGRHFHAENPAELAGILERETKTAVEAAAPDKFAAQPFRRFPRLDASTAPPLAGYVTLSPKPETEILLLARRRDPLLAWWRYGAGMTVAFAAPSSGSKGANWEKWDGLAPFWGRIARHAARPPAPPPAVDLSWTGSRATIAIDARLPGGRFAAEAQGRAILRRLDVPDPPEEYPLSLVAPYRLGTTLDIDGPSELAIELEGPDNFRVQTRVGLAPPASLEDPLAATNEGLLREVAALTGGKLDPRPAELLAGDGRGVEVRHPLATWLALAGLILLVADVTARRWLAM